MIELGTKLLIVIVVVNAIVNVFELILKYNKNWLDYDLETSKLAVKNKELDLEKEKIMQIPFTNLRKNKKSSSDN